MYLLKRSYIGTIIALYKVETEFQSSIISIKGLQINHLELINNELSYDTCMSFAELHYVQTGIFVKSIFFWWRKLVAKKFVKKKLKIT